MEPKKQKSDANFLEVIDRVYAMTPTHDTSLYDLDDHSRSLLAIAIEAMSLLIDRQYILRESESE